MIIIELTYKKPIDAVDKALIPHRQFLQKYYDQGLFLASGPKIPRDGGIIIALTNDTDQIEMIIKEDPFYQEEIADYRIVPFEPVKHRAELSKIIKG